MMEAYFNVQIALIFCRVWSKQSISCFVWIKCEIVMFCPGKTLCMYFLAALDLVCVDVMVMSSA